ncbi:hypothetical protein [Pantoea dispersa]|nr:hypothetical protein [Pantoea dispersa]
MINAETNKNLLIQMGKTFSFVHDCTYNIKVDLKNDFQKLNKTYFDIFCSYYYSFSSLVSSGHYSPAIVILRSMLEIHIKAVYVEFVEKPKGTEVSDILKGAVKFPSFYQMADTLDKYMMQSTPEAEGAYMQFTKKNLAQYNKFSYFVHGSGEFIEQMFHNGKFGFSHESINDILCSAKGLFETFSLFYFGVQGQMENFRKLASIIDNGQ